MATVRFSQQLAEEYERLYRTIEIKADKFDAVDRLVNGIAGNRDRYQRVGDALSGIPWYFIGAIHNMESSQRFDRHLHNGDPLSQRTRQVPAGRPRTGQPPFTWEESATDALRMKNLDSNRDWSMGRMLYLIEGYNGWGYRLYHPDVLSPYLWSFTNNYSSGKYVADGRWSQTAVSAQCGAAAIIRRLEEKGALATTPGAPRSSRAPIIKYGNRYNADAESLQRFLNSFDGISLRVDGKAGEQTSRALEIVLGHRLIGDPDA